MFPFDDNGNFVGEDNSDGVFPHRRLETLEELPNIQEEKPSRLLQINEDATSIRLIDTCGNPFSYVALSYCWGKDDGGDWKTTTHTLRSHTQHGLASKYLPLTLQHSLTITRRLGFSYIWIDALCIIQDSSEDWAREATKMAGVYFGSVLTIAASAAHSWSDGCFNQHSTRIIERGLYSDSWVVVESELSTGQSSRFLVHDSPLAKRGWTFQEHRLPRRTLYYTAEQLFWECQHCRRSEDNFPIQQNLGKHPILDTKRLTSDGVATLWYLGVVEDYSRRALTFSKDRLVAVSALAKATYFRRPQPYIAGLWRDSMMDGLM
ncbi:heterokaryon incompatibility protein-domain-containing protein, partial [Pyrenochaeta sp. MPI-SDFR-AT-0127]